METTKSIGKRKERVVSGEVDIASCHSFQILGQSGVIFGWHCDNIGVWTYITQEFESDSDLEG
jgi:hypothetical protein